MGRIMAENDPVKPPVRQPGQRPDQAKGQDGYSRSADHGAFLLPQCSKHAAQDMVDGQQRRQRGAQAEQACQLCLTVDHVGQKPGA